VFWNLFIRPKCRISEKVNVCVTAFELENEDLIRALFYKRHIGLDIITTSQHVTRELAYKQIYDMGDVVKEHFEFHERTLICTKCHLNQIGSMSSELICDFCHLESEYEKSTGIPWQ
jgi:hypothetical protein